MQLRRQHRIAYQTRIRLKSPDRDDSVVARVQNLSPHGVFVTASDLPEAGTEVICRLDLGGQHRTVRGRVAWVRQPSAATPDKSPGAGIEFLDLDEKDAELLNRVVEPDPRDSKPVDVWFEGMAAPIRCQAAVLGEGVRLATRLPFLRLNSTVRVSFGPNGGGNEEGTLDAVVLEPSSEDGVPRLQLNVSLLGRETATASPLEIDLDADPEVQRAAAVAPPAPPEPTPDPVHRPAVLSDFGPAFPIPSPAESADPPDPEGAQVLGAEELPTPFDPSDRFGDAGLTPTVSAGFQSDLSDPPLTPSSGANGMLAGDSEEPTPAVNGMPIDMSPVEPAADGSSPLVSHMVRLGPPPLPALRHRRQAPDSDKTPTVSDASSPQTIPPMSLSTSLSQPAQRRFNVWGLGAVALAAVAILVVVSSQRRSGSNAASAPPAESPGARPPEATPLAGAGAQAAKVAPTTPPPTAAPPVAISEPKKGTLTVQASGATSRFTFPLLGSTRGARRQLLTQPPGVNLMLPRARPKALPGTYKPAGDLLTVQVNRKGVGSELRFMYDPQANDATMEVDARKVTLQLVKKP
jgi:hypothetical protein